jgi:hypothetical protein
VKVVGQIFDRSLNGVVGSRSIRVDHATKFQSRALDEWKILPIGGGSSTVFDRGPVGNAFIESFFNVRLCDKHLYVRQLT